MAVLAEAISVIVRRETLEERYPGGVAAYREDCPNATFCADRHLTRVGFMTPVDTKAFVDALAAHTGMVLITEDEFTDIAIVDQNTGPTGPCPWLQFIKGADGVSRCWLTATSPGELATPEEWSPGDHASLHFVPAEDYPEHLVERTGHLDQMLDAESGKILYAGRPFGDLHEAGDLYRRAKQHEQVGELVEASHLYEEALRIRPENANLWYAAGVLRGQVDSAAAAIPYYEKAVEFAPTFQNAVCNLGVALAGEGRLEEALGWLQRAVQLEPDDPVARWGLATALEQAESAEAERAFGEFIRVVESNPDLQTQWEPMLRYAADRITDSTE